MRSVSFGEAARIGSESKATVEMLPTRARETEGGLLSGSSRAAPWSLTHQVPAIAEFPVGPDLAVITTGRRDVPAEHARLVRRLGEAGTDRVVLAGKAKLVNQVAKRVAGAGWSVSDRALKIDAAGVLLTRSL